MVILHTTSNIFEHLNNLFSDDLRVSCGVNFLGMTQEKNQRGIGIPQVACVTPQTLRIYAFDSWATALAPCISKWASKKVGRCALI
jgi:hypothetical protein